MTHYRAPLICAVIYIALPCCAQDEVSEATHAHGFASEFVHIFGATLEDGFFGGVKWGIAAAFYHIFYRALAMALSGVPSAMQSIKTWYTILMDTYAGRPPVLNVHELHVLKSLLQESLEEYEALEVVVKKQSCALVCQRTLEAVMRHINEYITIRIARYTNPYTDQELLFLMQLIVTTIASILECIAQSEFHKEIVATTKTTGVLMQKLIDLLQGPVVDKDVYDPSMAWFSSQRGFYVVPL